MRAGMSSCCNRRPHPPAIDEPARHCATELKATHYTPDTPPRVPLPPPKPRFSLTPPPARRPEAASQP